MTNAIADAYLKNSPSDNACTSPALQPAFEYIHSHKSEQVTLKHMADLCHLSPSYFSRLFSKETGRISQPIWPSSKSNGPSNCWRLPTCRSHRSVMSWGLTNPGTLSKFSKIRRDHACLISQIHSRAICYLVVDKHQNFTRIPFLNSNASFSKTANRERIQVFNPGGVS